MASMLTEEKYLVLAISQDIQQVVLEMGGSCEWRIMEFRDTLSSLIRGE